MNRIKCVLYDGIFFWYDKSPNFVELMLESWIFFIEKVVLIRTIKLILLITKLHSKGLERSIRNVVAKKKTLFDVFNRFLALQMKVCHFENVQIILHSFLVYT
jgi:hypothetical protein